MHYLSSWKLPLLFCIRNHHFTLAKEVKLLIQNKIVWKKLYVRIKLHCLWNYKKKLQVYIKIKFYYSPGVNSTIAFRHEYSARSMFSPFSLSTCSWNTLMWSMRWNTWSWVWCCTEMACTRDCSCMLDWAALRTNSSDQTNLSMAIWSAGWNCCVSI